MRLLRRQRFFLRQRLTQRPQREATFPCARSCRTTWRAKETMFGGTLLRARKVPSGVPTINSSGNNQIRAVTSNRYICSSRILASTHSLVDGSAHSCFYLSLQRLHSANQRTKFAIALWTSRCQAVGETLHSILQEHQVDEDRGTRFGQYAI
jgi:hypothetical protein